MATFEFDINEITKKITEGNSLNTTYIFIYFPILGQLLFLKQHKKLLPLLVQNNEKNKKNKDEILGYIQETINNTTDLKFSINKEKPIPLRNTDDIDTFYLNVIACITIPDQSKFKRILILQSYSMLNINIAMLSTKDDEPCKLILVSPKDISTYDRLTIHDAIIKFIHQLFIKPTNPNSEPIDELIDTDKYTLHPYTRALYDILIADDTINKNKIRKLCDDLYTLHKLWVDIVAKYQACNTHDDMEKFKKVETQIFAKAYQDIYDKYTNGKQGQLMYLSAPNEVIDRFKSKLMIHFATVIVYFTNYVKNEIYMLKNTDIMFMFGIKDIYNDLIKKNNHLSVFNSKFNTEDVNKVFNVSALQHVTDNANFYRNLAHIILK